MNDLLFKGKMQTLLKEYRTKRACFLVDLFTYITDLFPVSLELSKVFGEKCRVKKNVNMF